MSLDRELRRASDEVHAMVAHAGPPPIEQIIGRARRRRAATFCVSVLLVAGVVGVVAAGRPSEPVPVVDLPTLTVPATIADDPCLLVVDTARALRAQPTDEAGWIAVADTAGRIRELAGDLPVDVRRRYERFALFSELAAEAGRVGSTEAGVRSGEAIAVAEELVASVGTGTCSLPTATTAPAATEPGT